MVYRISFSIIFCTISIISAHAQLSKQDSIKLKNLLNGDGEININMEAIKNIHFDFNPSKELQKSKPIMSEEKRWMNYLEDLPKNYLDTTKWVKPKYIRLAPYTVYTKYGEDPVNDPILTDRKDTLSIKFKLRIEKILGMKNGYRVVPAGMDQSVTPSNNPVTSFSAEDILAPIFSKKARTKRKNAENANAWKTYAKAPVTGQFYKKKNKAVSEAKDSVNVKMDSVMIKRDTILVKNDSINIRKDSVISNTKPTEKINGLQNVKKESLLK